MMHEADWWSPLSKEPPLALRVIAPYQQEETHPRSLVTAMTSLVLDQQHPVALEIVKSEHRRGFQVRAKDAAGLRHLTSQLRSRYPQAEFVPVAPEEDPLRLAPDGAISMREIRLAADAFLPLRALDLAASETPPEADPVLGLLAAFDAVPEELRAVCQLALVPAPATWSERYQHKAEDPSSQGPQSRDTQSPSLSSSRQTSLFFDTQHLGSLPMFVGVLILVGGLLGWSYLREWLPSWAVDALTRLVHSQDRP
jgi:hypothetical protein